MFEPASLIPNSKSCGSIKEVFSANYQKLFPTLRGEVTATMTRLSSGLSNHNAVKGFLCDSKFLLQRLPAPASNQPLENG